MLSSVSAIQVEINRGFTPQHSSDSKKESSPAAPKNNKTETSNELSLEELKVIQELKARDQEVRTHEQAHLSAAGSLASGGANFTFAIGPDGRRYAIGGDVQVDISAIPGDPGATIRKADQIRRAAMAPASPSTQDQRVAANATVMANKAQMELLQQNQQLDGTKSEEQNSLGSILDISA